MTAQEAHTTSFDDNPGLRAWQDRSHGDDGPGQGGARRHRRHEVVLPQGRGRRRCCGSRAASTSRADASSSRPSSTPAPPHAGSARTSSRSTATTSEVVVISSGGLRKGTRYVVRVVKDGEALARQTGLLDSRGRPVRGLPPQVVSGAGCDSVAAWRGAFLAHGSLTEPGRSSALEVTCPGPGGGARARRGGSSAGHLGQGARGARGRPRRHPRRRRHQRLADPARRARVAAGLGGAPAAPRGAGDRQPARQLRRRQPAPLRSGRGGRRRPRRARARDPRRRGSRPPAAWRARCASSTSRPASRSSAQLHDPVVDQGRHRRPHPPPARDGRQAGAGARHPRHRGVAHPEMLSRRPSAADVASGYPAGGSALPSCRTVGRVERAAALVPSSPAGRTA